MITPKYTYTPMDRSSVDGKRHYCLPDGSRVPSVTTILDQTKPEESRLALANWRRRVGETKAREITTEAAGRGTRMHKWLENYVLTDSTGDPGTMPASQQSHLMAHTVISQGLVHATEFWGSEVPLYYSGLYAGTTDLVGSWKNQPAIMDFKQTNRPKKLEWISDYFIQLAAYAMAHNDMHGTSISTGVILMCSADNEYQEFVIQGDEFEHWSNEWLKRVEQYYISR
jgi:genome maintenance exonuclease 1